LLDFGLSKAVAPILPGASVSVLDTAATPAQLSEVGTFASTPQYMAPEQLDGRRADARSDIFALGVVIYEMATSTRAFAGSSTMALASANLHNQPPPIGSLQPDSPRGLDRLV